ncbi:hypothetical protein EJB05_12619, partial [Eragrostis curvula]
MAACQPLNHVALHASSPLNRSLVHAAAALHELCKASASLALGTVDGAGANDQALAAGISLEAMQDCFGFRYSIRQARVAALQCLAGRSRENGEQMVASLRGIEKNVSRREQGLIRKLVNLREECVGSILQPLTLYHCLQLSHFQSSRSDLDTLCIHYLVTDFATFITTVFEGPEKELLQLAVFGELRALFPGVHVHIDLVGPTVPKSRDGEVVSIPRYAHCSDESCCCKSGSEDLTSSPVTLKLWKGFYHERYRDIMKNSNPHLIFAPNAGVAAYPSWMPTIEIIRGAGIPAIFTDFCEEAAHLASCCISSITGQPLRIPIQVNPFRQPISVDNSALFLPCYSNCFVFGM